MSYLSYKYDSSVAEHWYPRRDAAWRARVDAALHWFQGGWLGGWYAQRGVYGDMSTASAAVCISAIVTGVR